MDTNIHAPTVPSGPTTSAYTNGHAEPLSLAELQKKKDDIEAELKALGSVLDSHNVNMETPLLTADGFPRADIDVPQIRTTRARIIRLRNDYKELMARVDKHLQEHFANMQDEPDEPASLTQPSALPDTEIESLDAPFAKVNTVATGSPAEAAGLRPGDEIRNFGPANRDNHDNLRKVMECVLANEDRNIFIRISRSTTSVTQREELRLTLTPRKDWGGRGMLGCHILPI